MSTTAIRSFLQTAQGVTSQIPSGPSFQEKLQSYTPQEAKEATAGLFSVSGRIPKPGGTPKLNLLKRSLIPVTMGEWGQVMKLVSPKERLFTKNRMTVGGQAFVARTKYAFNEGGLIFFPFTEPEQRDHFLPWAGLSLIRTFDDPRFTTQITHHTFSHLFYPMPLPLLKPEDMSGSQGLFYWKGIKSEVISAMETEFAMFEEFVSETEGMFPAHYKSTYEAFQAVGIRHFEQAMSAAMYAQQHRTFPADVMNHPEFGGPVAVSILRYASWPEHNSAWAYYNWQVAQDPALQNVFKLFWPENVNDLIEERYETRASRSALRAYFKDHHYNLMDHKRNIAKNCIRVIALYLYHNEEVIKTLLSLYNDIDQASQEELEDLIDILPEWYDYALEQSGLERDDPMPLWKAATDFRDFRSQWEVKLQARTQELMSQFKA